MFEKTLTDVVKGIRASKRDTALYISQCIAEIKVEINSTDPYVKANALQKITFLQMMGYSMSWANFASIEVMSFPRFAHKRIGYLAASQGFTQDTDVILLTTNLLKKELRGAANSGNMKGVYEAGLAINCLSNIVTEDLARDLLPEVTNLTQHPQPYLRKKAVLCLFKLFVKYPQGLRLTFAKVQQCLDDQNASVVSCAVNVITELSDKNPKNYLHLAPAFFQLLTSSSNNWMLIKVVKLLGSLVQEEPRLARKLLEPLANIVKSTQAKSLLYEAVHTITLSLPYCRKADGTMPPSVPGIITLCAQTLREFVEEADQNLKYLGLVGFGSLMASAPKVLLAPDYRPLILACLSDEDVTIRTRALDLLGGMASRKNLRELVSQLVKHVELAAGAYKNDLVLKIVEMCSCERYALLQDFAWYLDVLLELGHERGIDVHAELLANQVSNVALRVLPVRAYAVRRGMQVLQEGEKKANIQGNNMDNMDGQGGFASDNGRGKHIMPEMLPSVAWIVGEYSDLIREASSNNDEENPLIMSSTSKGYYHGTVQALTAPSNTQKLPTTTQSVYVQASMKVFAAATADDKVSAEELEACVDTLASLLPLYMQSTDVEVQERTFTSFELLRALDISVDGGFGTDLPNLTLMGKDYEESSHEDTAVVEDDLLGVGSDPEKSSSKISKFTKKTTGLAGLPSGSSVSSRCRQASSTLNYLFKPEPMKPTSVKAQKKKHQSPIGFSGEELEAPVDLSVFAQLLEDERSQRPAGGGTISIESVSFTQQRPLRSTNASVDNVGHHVELDSPNLVDENNNGRVNGSAGTFASSFQGTIGGETGALAPQLNRSNQNDPFYLDAGGNSGMTADAREQRRSGFDTIQLLDSDAEEDREAQPKKKKKQQKKEIRRKQKKAGHSTQISEDDLAIFSTGKENPKPSADIDYTVYSSDEEEHEHRHRARGSIGRGKGVLATNKEFEGLAKVDLTTPLRDDEVMPTREHRVVPDRPSPEALPVSSEVKKKKKKKESKKTKKKHRHEKSSMETTAKTGDLLDLGGFESVLDASASSSQPLTSSLAPAAIMQSSSTPISTAFDDLLGLTSEPVSDPAPSSTNAEADSIPSRTGFETLGGVFSSAGTQPLASANASDAKSSGKHAWLKCSVKASSGSGAVDWANVSLYAKVYPHSGGATAMTKIKVLNNTENALVNVVIKLKGHYIQDIVVGSVSPGGTAESSKVGPIPCDAIQGSATDVRGSVASGDNSVGFKLVLPATLGLTPVEGLTQDAVLSELSSGPWASHSVTIHVSSESHKKAKSIVGSFLQAAEVEAETTSANSGTFAAVLIEKSAQVRVLVKIKSSSVKVDIKSTDASLAKALASSLKKIAL